MIRPPVRVSRSLRAAAVLLSVTTAVDAGAQGTSPAVNIVEVDNHRLPAQVDSNSPGVWSTDGSTYTVFMSYAGWPQRATGPSLRELGNPSPVVIVPSPDGGTWIEAVVRDGSGALFGYYHNEVPDLACNGPKMRPRVGAARSMDEGVTWQNLGVVWVERAVEVRHDQRLLLRRCR